MKRNVLVCVSVRGMSLRKVNSLGSNLASVTDLKMNSYYNATFDDEVHHCTNDLAMYSSFRKRFEKKFDRKSDDQIDVYLCNHIVQDRAKGTVTMSQEHYLMACLEKFGLADCNGVDKPIASRLTVQDQQETSSLCCDFGGDKTFTTRWPDCRVVQV